MCQKYVRNSLDQQFPKLMPSLSLGVLADEKTSYASVDGMRTTFMNQESYSTPFICYKNQSSARSQPGLFLHEDLGISRMYPEFVWTTMEPRSRWRVTRSYQEEQRPVPREL